MTVKDKPSWFLATSLTSQRSRYHLKIAVALTVVIPMLSFVLIGLSLFTSVVTYSLSTQAGVMLAGLVSGLIGYSMLSRYPANIERLRVYLERMAAEDLPEQATLLASEQDIGDIERALNRVIHGMQERIIQLDTQLKISQEMLDTIQKQSAEIIAAEQQRVMIESLGAACHHLGQPATILSLYLSRVKDIRPEVLEQEEFEACWRAVEDISDVLKKLKQVSEYRTTPYATFTEGIGSDVDRKPRILDIHQSR